MSFKTASLLSRSGRNQFGDQGEVHIQRHTPSPESIALADQMKVEHRKLNELFVEKHGAIWLSRFEGKTTRKDAWEVASPQGIPSYSTFCKECREYPSLDEYLYYLMLSRKKWALSLMGLSKEEISSELKAYKDCGCYQVTFRSGSKPFFTMI